MEHASPTMGPDELKLNHISEGPCVARSSTTATKRGTVLEMRTSPFLMRIRALTRRVGLNWLVAKLVIDSGRGREDRFSSSLVASIRPGDTVWDVGANVGDYIATFLDATSPSGKVLAFEPVEACVRAIVERFGHEPRLTVMPLALGADCGSVTIVIGDYELSTYHRVVTAETADGRPTQTVKIVTGASISEEYPDLFPNVVKIDVEGHEGRVIDGMQPILIDPRLRVLAIEMHFALLDKQGESATPSRIESRLRFAGFTVSWTDSSHLIAHRAPHAT